VEIINLKFKLMNSFYENKAEVCYKDVCATFYDKNADAITAAVIVAIIAIAAGALIKAIN